MKLTTRDIVMTGLMIALAAVLAQFPINGSIGLDAMPAFFAAAAIGPVLGGFVGLVAHLLIAGFSGFVMTLPIHLVVALTMFLSCWGYGFARARVNRYVAMAVGILLNGPVALFIAAMVAQALGAPFSGMTMFAALIGPLTLVAAINVILADVLFGLIGRYVQENK